MIKNRSLTINNEINRRLNIAVLDIETTDLDANYGYVLCAVVKKYAGPMWTFRIDSNTFNGELIGDDRKLIRELVSKLKEFDVIVTWNGNRFDMPFINTKLIRYGLKPLGLKYYRDLCAIARARFRTSNNRLRTWGNFLLGASRKTFTTSRIRLDAIRGKKYALDFIVNHCRIDVEETERLYKKMLPFLNPDLKRR